MKPPLEIGKGSDAPSATLRKGGADSSGRTVSPMMPGPIAPASIANLEFASKRGVGRAHLLNIALITFATLVLFWRVFFLGQTLIDVATLNNQLPWGYSAGRTSDYPYDRRDETDMYLTRDYFVVQAYRAGELPLWNPYTMAGHPIYADGVARIFSPFLLFYTFLDMPLGYSVARITELLLAAIFLYAFLAGIGIGPPGALLGSLAFEFSSHAMLHLSALGWFGGLMWLPLILLFAYRAVVRNSIGNALISGVFLAIQFYCGFLANQIYYVGAVGLFYLYCWLAVRRGHGPAATKFSFGRMMGTAAATFLVGFGLAATQWLPTFELLKYSNRLIVPTGIGYIYLPPWYALTLVFPNLFGSAYDPESYHLYSGVNVSHDHILYLGIAALVPLGFLLYKATSGWRIRRGNAHEKVGQNVPVPAFSAGPSGESDIPFPDPGRRLLMTNYFVVLTAIALILMMGAPLYVHITRFLPVLQTIRVIMRASVLFVFAISALVAVGTDAMISATASHLSAFWAYWRRFLIGAAAFVVLGIAGSYSVRLAGLQSRGGGLRGALAFVRRAILQIAQQFAPPNAVVLIPLFLLLVSAVLIWLLAQSKIDRGSFFWVLALLLLCDLFWSSRGLNPAFDRSRVYPRTQVTDYIRQLPPGRVLVTPSDIDLNVGTNPNREKIIAPPNTLLAYGIPVLAGKDQLFPKTYKEYCALAERQQNLSHVVFNVSSSRYLDLLNARYILTHDYSPSPKDCHLLLTAEGLSLYENTAALPRAFFAEDLMQVATDKDAEAAVRAGALTQEQPAEPGVDKTLDVASPANRAGAPKHEKPTELPVDKKTGVAALGVRAGPLTQEGRNAVVVSQEPLPGVGAKSLSIEVESIGPPTAKIVEDKRNRVTISTDYYQDRMLVLSDNYYPGWQAYIDGAPVQIKRANLSMRAVAVPAGSHVISFVFAPKILIVGIYASALSALGLLTCAAFLLVRNRRSNQEQRDDLR